MRSVGATAPEKTVASIWSMSRSSPATTGAYPSTTWSRIAHSADVLPAVSSSGRCSSRCLAPRNSLATPCRTVITEVGFGEISVLTRGAQDDQPHVCVVELDFRPQMKVLRVLDRQLMQPKGVTHLGQLLRTRLEQP